MQWLLLKERKSKGLTQKQMADLLKISEVSYRQKELGRSQFKMDEMFFIADYFNKSISEIFTKQVHET